MSKKSFLASIMIVGLFLLFLNFGINQSYAQSSVTFAVIGDYGTDTQPELDVSNLVKSYNPDFIVTVGDNQYPVGDSETIDAKIGKYYHEYIYNYTGIYGNGSSTQKFYPAIGNHDAQISLDPYLDYFTLPNNERYYDFIENNIHFFIINSDISEPDGNIINSIQHQWLVNQTAASTTDMRVVVFHHAPYSSGLHGNSEFMQWDFKNLGIDVVLTGHDHDYERLSNDGLTYIVNGIGGKDLRSFNVIIPQSQYRYNQDFGAIIATGNSDSINFKFINKNYLVIDDFSIDNQGVLTENIVRETTPSYLIYKDQTQSFAKNLISSNIDYQGSDSFVIQTVLNSFVDSGEVILAPQTFFIDSRIEIDTPNTSFKGTGPANTKIILKNNTNPFAMLRINADSISVSDFTLDGNSKNQQSNSGNGIHWKKGSGISIKNIDIFNTRGNGMLVSDDMQNFLDLDGSIINDIKINNTGVHSIEFINVTNLVLSDGSINNPSQRVQGGSGIRIQNSSEISFSDQIIKLSKDNTQGFGIIASSDSSNLTFTKNQIAGGSKAMAFYNTKYFVINLNILENEGSNIGLYGDTKDYVIISNVLFGDNSNFNSPDVNSTIKANVGIPDN